MKKLFGLIQFKWFFITAVAAFTIVSCEKKEDEEINLPRQFKPGDINITTEPTRAILQWSASLFADTATRYTVQLSQDPAFANVIATAIVNAPGIILTDSILLVRQTYYARVKANEVGTTTESSWVNSAGFSITGEQIFLNVQDADLKDTSVILKWSPSPGLTTIQIKTGSSAAVTINLTPADVAANQKKINGLTPLTLYTAEIFKGTTQKGQISFTTKEKNIFSVVLNPGDDLVAAINNAVNGDVIGLEPGTYNATNALGAFVNFVVLQKTITIQAKSGDASNTKVNSKQFDIKGTGAGIVLKGIEFNGTAANADYFINFVGLTTDAENANFTKVKLDNVVVKYTNNSLIRGNRGGNNGQKIDSIQLKNSIFSDNGSGGFDYILLDKMEFKSVEILNSTFYNSGRRLISWATNITAPKPVIMIDKTTINSIGYGARDNVLLDANANPVDFTLKNSILANAPKPAQTLGNNLLRASAGGSSVLIAHTNMFNLTNGAAPPVNLVIPAYVTQQNNIAVDLGWTGSTTSFTLPAASPVRTASESGGPIGDPRWW